MTGQEAVKVAETFLERLPLTALVLTKMDGDARGGAALSIRSMTGLPVAYVGTGEAVDALEVFHPDRLAQRILGMGDIVTLVERAEERIDRDEAERAAQQMMEGAVHARGLPQPASAGEEDGTHRSGARRWSPAQPGWPEPRRPPSTTGS